MNRDFQIRFTAGLLILLTTAAVVLAWINFQKEARLPDSLGRRLVDGTGRKTTAAWWPNGSKPTAPAIRPAFEWATA